MMKSQILSVLAPAANAARSSRRLHYAAGLSEETTSHAHRRRLAPSEASRRTAAISTRDHVPAAGENQYQHSTELHDNVEYAQFDARRRQFRALTTRTRQVLSEIYASKEAQAGDGSEIDARKKAAMEDFRQSYAALRANWSGPRQGAYDGWVARANNALFGAQAAYDELVPGFEALFEREGRDWPRFYAAVKRLAELGKDERTLALRSGDAAAPAARRPTEEPGPQGRPGGPGA